MQTSRSISLPPFLLFDINVHEVSIQYWPYCVHHYWVRPETLAMTVLQHCQEHARYPHPFSANVRCIYGNTCAKAAWFNFCIIWVSSEHKMMAWDKKLNRQYLYPLHGVSYCPLGEFERNNDTAYQWGLKSHKRKVNSGCFQYIALTSRGELLGDKMNFAAFLFAIILPNAFANPFWRTSQDEGWFSSADFNFISYASRHITGPVSELSYTINDF